MLLLSIFFRSRRGGFQLSPSAKVFFLAALWLRITSILCHEFSEDIVAKKEILLQSLWETFKQNLEASKKDAQSSFSPSQSEIHPQKTQNYASSSRNRRVLLMKKTIEEHFSKSHRSKNHRDFISQILDDSSEISQKECLIYTENPGAYWSFQWCPKLAVFQGHQEGTEMDKQISLGFYSEMDDTSYTDESTSRLYSLLRKLYPKATLELYKDGDLCNENGKRRLTMAIVHDDSSQVCMRKLPKDSEHPVIIKIEESQICSYLMHVCKPTNTSSKDNFDSELKGHQDRQTFEGVHRALNAYLRQTSEQNQQTINPDRTTSLHLGLPPLPQSRIEINLHLIKDMFIHAYDSYMYNAYPACEIKPLTCKPAVFSLVRIPALTLIDSLDTLIILGNYTEFARSVERLRGLHEQMAEINRLLDKKGGLFALNQNVSVFETNIRVLGGLLSAHQLAEATLSSKVFESDVWDEDTVRIGESSKMVCSSTYGYIKLDRDKTDFSSSLLQCKTFTSEETTCQNHTSTYWEYDGFLLELAQDIGSRLLPAFATRTGIPYGTVNLLSGIPKDETTIASLAGGGTLSLEMELLSRLTGNPEYGRAAKLSARALWMRRSRFNTFGKHICTERGEWTEYLSGIGSNSDSYYEYLIKHYILFPEDHDFWFQMVSAYGGVYNESRLGDWYGDVDLNKGLSSGGGVRRVFEALMAFYPGMQILLGELAPAARSLNSFFLVREFLGFLPERFDFAAWKVDSGGGTHFLRPELLESTYFLHRATKGFQHQLPIYSNNTNGFSGWQWAADYALHTLDRLARSKCGFATMKDVSPMTTGAAGLSSEKSYKKGNQVDEMPSFFLSETLKYLYLTFDEHNILHSDEDRDWVFTTEAHPIHHPDVSIRQDKEHRLQNQTKELLDRLRSRVQGGENKTPSPWNVLNTEKWTDGSPLEFFVEQMEPIVDQSIRGVAHRSPSITEPILSRGQVYLELDFFDETQNGLNDAHLAIRKNGSDVSLVKSCPNFYSPELLWVRALNGGSTDYSNAYASSVHDSMTVTETRFLMMGSFDALAMHGSGVHIAEINNVSHLCPVKDMISQNAKPNAETKTNPQNNERNGNNHFDGGELGNFEISAFPGGAGFFIKHVESGEQYTTSLIQEANHETDGEVETYLMVHSNAVFDIKQEAFPNHGTSKATVSDGTIIMADLNGNTFLCQVEIIQSADSVESDRQDHSTNSADVAMESVLARYPCAPALFGPTHLKELGLADGIVVEAPLRIPVVGDEQGCTETIDLNIEDIVASSEEDGQTVDNSKQSIGHSFIQVVKRGVCTFQEKSMNQKPNAKSVIVINTEKDELFVMSGGSAHPNLQDDKTYPVTVLISGSDGEKMISLVNFFTPSDSSRLFTRVSLIRENIEIREKNKMLSVHGNKYWPVVSARPEGIKVFSKAGWGVHAGQISNSAANKAVQWQLYLMKHGEAKDYERDDTQTL